MRRHAPSIISFSLMLLAILGALAWTLGPQFPKVQDLQVVVAPMIAMLERMGHTQLPAIVVTPPLAALIVGILMMRRAFRLRLRADYERTWRAAQQQARSELAYEIRMLEHGPLKGHVREAQRLLAYASSVVEGDQETLRLRLKEVDYSLQRLLRLVIDLHGQAEARTRMSERGSLLPSDFQRTVLEMTRNFGKLILCRAAFGGHTPSAISSCVSGTLLLALSNALTNALDHGRAKDILVRIDYHLDSIRMSVRDDGCGFDVQQARTERIGRGLFDLENLARSLGGTLTITSEIGHGTEVTITLPLIAPDLGWAAMSYAVPTHSAYEPPRFNEGDFDAQIFDETPLGTGDEGGLSGTDSDPNRAAPLPPPHASAHSHRGRPGERARSDLHIVDPPWIQRDRG